MATAALPWLRLLLPPAHDAGLSAERRRLALPASSSPWRSGRRSDGDAYADDEDDVAAARADTAFHRREAERLQEAVRDRDDAISHLERLSVQRDAEWLAATRSAVQSALAKGEQTGSQSVHAALECVQLCNAELEARAVLCGDFARGATALLSDWAVEASGIEAKVTARREKAAEFDRVARTRREEELVGEVADVRRELVAARASAAELTAEIARLNDQHAAGEAARTLSAHIDHAEPSSRAAVEAACDAGWLDIFASCNASYAAVACQQRDECERSIARCTEELAAALRKTKDEDAAAQMVAAMEQELSELADTFETMKARSDSDRAHMSATLLTALEASSEAVAEQHRAHVEDAWAGATAALQRRAADVRAARLEADNEQARESASWLGHAAREMLLSLAVAEKTTEFETHALDADLAYEETCAGPHRLRLAVNEALADARAAHAVEQRRTELELANVRQVADRTDVAAAETNVRIALVSEAAEAQATLAMGVAHAGAQFGIEDRLLLENDAGRLKEERDTLLDALELERAAREAAEVRAAEAESDARELSAALDGARAENQQLANMARDEHVGAAHAGRTSPPTLGGYDAVSSPSSHSRAHRTSRQPPRSVLTTTTTTTTDDDDDDASFL